MSCDLRQQYDPKGPQVHVVADRLHARYPISASETELPGLDCLIVVLRSIYGRFVLGAQINFRWINESEKENPILGYAWLSFGLEPIDLEEAAGKRNRMLQSLDFSATSFEDFCNSALMNETFWANLEFRLYQSLINVETGEKVNCTPAEVARLSLLELNLAKNPELTLERVLESSFGVFTYKDQRVLFRPSRPLVIRLSYQPNLEPSESLNIGALRVLHLTRWQLDPSFAGTRYIRDGYDEYSLMVVVRLKDEHHPQEYVRTYTSYGAHIVPEYKPESFVDDEWSIKDTPGRYMIFYALKARKDLEDPRRYPEVAVPVLSEEDREAISRFNQEFRKATSGGRWERPHPPPGMQAAETHKAAGQSSGSAQPQSDAAPGESPRQAQPNNRKRKSNRGKGGRQNDDNSSQPPPNSKPDEAESQAPPSSKPHESEVRRDSRRSPAPGN